MSRYERKPINRRRFLRNGTVAVVAARLFGVHPSLVLAQPTGPSAPADATELMKAAAAGVRELNSSFTKWAAEVEKSKAILEKHKELAGIMTVVQVIVSIILIIISVVIATVTFGAGGTLVVSAVTAQARLTDALIRLANAERDIKGAALVDASIGAAIANVRLVVADVKDAVVARDILFRLSQDRVYASAMFEAVSAGRRSAMEAMLKTAVAGSIVTVQNASVTGALTMSLRINNFNYCLSSASACGGKQLTFRR